MYEARRLRFSILMAIASTGGASVLACSGDSDDTGQTSTGGSGGTATGGTSSGGTSSGGSGGTSTGGTSSGGTAGVSTGGTAGVSSGGTAGVSSGGSAGAAPLCPGGQTEQCFTLDELENLINNPPQGGDVAEDAGADAHIEVTDCVDKSMVLNGCCIAASAGPVKQGDTCCYTFCDGACCGRPFVVDGQARLADCVARADWRADLPVTELEIDPVTRASLAAAWLEDARMEHASVASFARFTLDLLALAAPPDLIFDAQSASLDEIEHARLCFEQASRFGQASMGPGALSMTGTERNITLTRSAAAVVSEGCVGETIAALVAREQAARAEDPAARQALNRIADDEERHAALAWRYVRWAIETGGETVRRAVEASFRQSVALARVAPAPSYEVRDLAAWQRHGRLAHDETLAVTRAALDDVIVPCAKSLLNSAAVDVQSAVA
jgi:hypothetical protein